MTGHDEDIGPGWACFGCTSTGIYHPFLTSPSGWRRRGLVQLECVSFLYTSNGIRALGRLPN